MIYKFLPLFILPIIVISFSTFAQRGEKVESIKIAYLSEKLNLDPKTAEKFWPIYNQYDDEMRTVIQESKKANDTRTVEEIIDQEQKAIDIKRKYNALFLKVLSNEQATKLYQSEKEFHRILLRRMNKIDRRAQFIQRDPGDQMPNRQRMNQRPREEMTRPQPQERPKVQPQERPKMQTQERNQSQDRPVRQSGR
jgi:hypothetical protein